VSRRKREFTSGGRRDRQLGESTRELPAYAEKKIRKAKAEHELSLAHGLDRYTLCWVKNWLDGRAQ